MSFFSDLWSRVTGQVPDESNTAAEPAVPSVEPETPADQGEAVPMNEATAPVEPAAPAVAPTGGLSAEQAPAAAVPGNNLGVTEPKDDSSSAISPNAPEAQPTPEQAQEELMVDINNSPEVTPPGEMPNPIAGGEEERPQ